MTTYWLLGEKASSTLKEYFNENHRPQNNVVINPSITLQGPDSPAATHNPSPEKNTIKHKQNHRPLEILNERERIKHEIATFVAKDLINNIDIAVKEFRKSQSANFACSSHGSKNSFCNGGNKGLITPTYDKELVISKGKVRDVVNRFNKCVVSSPTNKGSQKIKNAKAED